MNRGVEIASEVADGAQSLIREQVEMGVAVRMAVLEALAQAPAERVSAMTADRPRRSLLAERRLVDPGHRARRSAARVLVATALIADVGLGARRRRAGRRRGRSTARGMVLAPGLVDMRAFVGEPGAEHRETLAHARARRRRPAASRRSSACRTPTRRSTTRRSSTSCCAAPATRRSSTSSPAAALTKGLAGREMTEIGLLQRGRRGRLHRRRALASPTRR